MFDRTFDFAHASRLLAGLLIALSLAVTARGQSGSSDLKLFGYFQPQFFYQSDSGTAPAQNSFVLQQLNLFFQKDLAPKLSAFVNFETVNSFSSDQQWGSFRLEEAWARYRQSRNLNIKLGLQIPIFNNLNEIKNRTPLIPYVIRPLVYESSFVDVIPIRFFVPQQAFVQVYGWTPIGDVKVDYAGYLGNTELVNSGYNADPDGRPGGQTGIDTTEAILIGGRVGLRYQEFKAGLSATSDRSAVFQGIQGAAEDIGIAPGKYGSTPRYRIGADASYYLQRFSLEAEWIHVYLDEPREVSLDLAFYYVTLGCRLTDRLFAYLGYWTTEERVQLGRYRENVNIRTPVAGLAYSVEDQITFKIQHAHVDVDVDFNEAGTNIDVTQTNTFEYFTLAVSVAF